MEDTITISVKALRTIIRSAVEREICNEDGVAEIGHLEPHQEEHARRMMRGIAESVIVDAKWITGKSGE